MPETTSTRLARRARGRGFLVYLAVCSIGLLLVMFIVADRISKSPSNQGVESELVSESTPSTVAAENEFLPAERDISDCISAIPKPGCGSEARGGWRQTLVFLVILGGLGLIAWRVVASARRSRTSP